MSTPYHVGLGWKEHRAVVQWLYERGNVYGQGTTRRQLLHRASDILGDGVPEGSGPVDSSIPITRRFIVADHLGDLLTSGWYEEGPDSEAIAEAIHELHQAVA